MRDFWNALGLLLLAVVIIYVVTNWNKVKGYFNSATSTATSSDTSTASNTSTATSVDTTTSTGINPPLTSNRIKVINQAGARVSHMYNMNGNPLFVLTNYYIPVNTLISYYEVVKGSNYTYYRTNAGWVLANDVQAF